MNTAQNTMPAEITEIIHVPVKLSDRKTTQKMTIARQKRILEDYQQHGNLTKACARNNVTRVAFWQELQKNPQLREAYQMIEDAQLDTIEETSLTVALRPSREGFNDRKMMLQAKRPEIYGNKVQVDQTTRLEAVVVHADLRNILTSNKLSID